MAVLLCAVKKTRRDGQLRHVNAHPTLIVPKDGKQEPVIAKVSQETK
jgi:hypothetical protein